MSVGDMVLIHATNCPEAVTLEKVQRLVDFLQQTIAALQSELKLSA